jgi:hypothetical protein
MQAVLKALNRTPTHWVVGLASSAVTSARGQRAWITYDARTGGWRKWTAGGTTVYPISGR